MQAKTAQELKEQKELGKQEKEEEKKNYDMLVMNKAVDQMLGELPDDVRGFCLRQTRGGSPDPYPGYRWLDFDRVWTNKDNQTKARKLFLERRKKRTEGKLYLFDKPTFGSGNED